jgi:hypothetical protein
MLLKDRKTKAEAGVLGDDAQGAPDATGAGVSSRTFWMAAAELAFWNLAAQAYP